MTKVPRDVVTIRLCVLAVHTAAAAVLVQSSQPKAHLEVFLVLERIVVLSVRHRAGLEPAVEHAVVPPQHALALPRRDGQVVNEVPVQVVHLQWYTQCCYKVRSGSLGAAD